MSSSEISTPPERLSRSTLEGEREASTFSSDTDVLSWDQRVTLLTDRFILVNLLVVFGISFGFVVLVIVTAITWEGSWDRDTAMSLARGLGIVVIVLLLLMIFAMGVVMGNRSDMSFRLDRQGVTCATGSRERKLNRIALIVGMLTANPRLLGAALISTSREEELIGWNDVEQLGIHRREHVICLRDSWHDVMRLYCPPDRFAEIEQFVLREFERRAGRRARARQRAALEPPWHEPWPRVMLWLVLVAVAFTASISWYWASESAGPFSLAAALLVLISGVLRGGLQRFLAVLGAVVSLVFLGIVAYEALGSFRPIGGGLAHVWELDTEWLVAATLGGLALLGLAVFRFKEPTADTATTRSLIDDDETTDFDSAAERVE
jgi:hypothetical protein